MNTLILDDPYQEIPEVRARDIVRFWFSVNLKQKGGGGIMSAKSMTIRPILNGFIVEVGCQTVVVTSTTRLAREIERYYDHPEEVEAEYLKDAVNKAIQPIPAMPPGRIEPMKGTPTTPSNLPSGGWLVQEPFGAR